MSAVRSDDEEDPSRVAAPLWILGEHLVAEPRQDRQRRIGDATGRIGQEVVCAEVSARCDEGSSQTSGSSPDLGTAREVRRAAERAPRKQDAVEPLEPTSRGAAPTERRRPDRPPTPTDASSMRARWSSASERRSRPARRGATSWALGGSDLVRRSRGQGSTGWRSIPPGISPTSVSSYVRRADTSRRRRRINRWR